MLMFTVHATEFQGIR